MPRYRNVILTGFMGTGKSSVGQRLAHELGWLFVDTDQVVEAKARCTIPEIFEKQGEPYFRQLETEVLQEVLRRDGQVVSTGGGSVLREENRRIMLGGGLVVALRASETTIFGRVRGDSSRPLLRGNAEERVRTLMEARRNAYDFAPVQIDTDGADVAALSKEIRNKMEIPFD